MLSARGEVARLNPLTYDEGISVGSTRIDQAALKYLLSSVKGIRGVDFPLLAEEAVCGGFQEIKHDYGTDTSNRSYYLLPIPSLTTSDNLPLEHFQGTSFKIPAKVIKAWFDEEIDQIIALGEKQLRTLHEGHKKEKVRWMVLSGGFGQNQYVRDRLKEYLRSIPTSKDSAVEPEVDVLTADNPQLAVVRGLVYNRAQEMLGLTPVYEQVCCRMSYGIVVQEEYNKRRHQGQIPRKSESDGKLWVHGQIDWIIKQGVLVPSTGMSKTYEWALTDGDDEDQEETWTCHIVSCEHPRAHLPLNISHKEVKSVCKLEVDLEKLSYQIRRRSLLKKETAYRVVKFDLLILIGAADLRFQVHPRGESDTLASREHEEIDVVWMKDEEAANVAIPSSEGKQPALSDSQAKGKNRMSLSTHFKKPKW
jgi:hypothetical protein